MFLLVTSNKKTKKQERIVRVERELSLSVVQGAPPRMWCLDGDRSKVGKKGECRCGWERSGWRSKGVMRLSRGSNREGW
jgi:hypothetical protein